MASLGFRAVAPDMRGYGRSSVYNDSHDAYRQEEIVADMLELLKALGRETAVWVGHDWGAPVVWNIASHHPEACAGVASLCVPYWTLERGLEHTISSVDRKMYPEDKFPAGQWEYMKFYESNFDDAKAQMEMNTYNTAKVLFRRGDPSNLDAPAMTAFVRIMGGWFGPPGQPAPDMPRDDAVVSEADLAAYASSLERNGFFGPDSWYMNHSANAAYASRARYSGTLRMPVLFIAAEYDRVCSPDMAAEMPKHCEQLTAESIKCGHWMAQECPTEVNAMIVRWLATQLPWHWQAPEQSKM